MTEQRGHDHVVGIQESGAVARAVGAIQVIEEMLRETVQRTSTGAIHLAERHVAEPGSGWAVVVKTRTFARPRDLRKSSPGIRFVGELHGASGRTGRSLGRSVAAVHVRRWSVAVKRPHLRAMAGERMVEWIFECTSDPALVVRADATIVRANRAVESVLGYVRGSLEGRSLGEIVGPEERVGVIAFVAHHAGVDEPGRLLTCVCTISGGSRQVLLHGAREGDGLVVVMCPAERAQVLADKQIQEYTLQLERSNRELERFASIASHDLQEPLRKILAFGDRLNQKHAASLSEAGSDCLARIGDAARRMQDLINDILVYSRLTSSGKPLVPVDLDKVVVAVLSDLEVQIEQTSAKIEVGSLPRIYADQVHMRQLFQNLLGNALKFRRPDVAPEITVSGTLLGLEGSAAAMVRIVVADNGIGIDPRYSRRIFGIFERLHGRGKYEGTGIGLAVCRKICEQLGGTIVVDSDGDHGSAFIVELPAQQRERQP